MEKVKTELIIKLECCLGMGEVHVYECNQMIVDPYAIKGIGNFWKHYTLKDSFFVALPLLCGLQSFEDLNLPAIEHKSIPNPYFYVKKTVKNGIIGP